MAEHTHPAGSARPSAAPDRARAEDARVLIVGAGPVGLLMACELARRDVPVRVVDSLTSPPTQSRPIVIHARSLEMLRSVGVLDEIVASGVRTDGMTMHDGHTIIVDLPFDSVDSAYPFSVTTGQTETERILGARLVELGGRVERGVSLQSFDQDDCAVRFTLVHADGSTETGTVDWIVGTDGAHSTVRSLTGQTLVGSSEGERFLMGDVDADDDLARNRVHTFFAAAAGPSLVFPMQGRRARVITQIAVDDHRPPSLEWLQEETRSRGVDMRMSTAHWMTVFEIRRAQVAQYRVGRALLAGDAAHVHSPAGGQGMNTGMQDAFNLGWKLAAVVHGDADQTLLDSYQAERHPVAAEVIEQTTRLTTLGTLKRPVQRRLRNGVVHAAGKLRPAREMMAAQVDETGVGYRRSPIVAGRRWRGRLHPGDHAPHVAGTDLDERLAAHSGGYVAVVFGSDSADDALAGMARIVVASARAAGGGDDVVDDPDDSIAERYGCRPGDVVLVRPDGYIGYIGSRSDAEPIGRFLASAGAARRSVSGAA